MIKVLVACEESQAVCAAFVERGFDAYSCDLKPTSGKYPGRHFQMDIKECLGLFELNNVKLDLIIAHPPCTYLATCGNRWMKNNPEREKKREEALAFFRFFYEYPNCDHIAIENPIGVASTRIAKPTQIIEPWQFGDSASKKTCLWLKGLPKLNPTNIVDKGEIVQFDSGRRMPKWYADLWALSPEKRSEMRSKTFPGIAAAMAEQWGNYLLGVEE